MKQNFRLAVGIIGVVLDACSGPGTSSNEVGQGASTNLDQGASSNLDQGTPTQLQSDGTGPFCPVQALLESRCQNCHSDPPLTGVPMPLGTYDDLLAPATTDPSLRAVDVSIARMQDSTAPMPPLPAAPATADEVAILQDWVNQGMPSTCDTATVTTNDVYDTPLVCSSGDYTRGGESSNMDPGRTCISCHASSREGPRYELAGTVYPTAHEPDDCNGVNGGTSGAQVVVIDATGAQIVLQVNSVGNFYSREAFTAPYAAKVVKDGQERVMLSTQEDGDCNGCHSENGTNQAPGRIMLP